MNSVDNAIRTLSRGSEEAEKIAREVRVTMENGRPIPSVILDRFKDCIESMQKSTMELSRWKKKLVRRRGCGICLNITFGVLRFCSWAAAGGAAIFNAFAETTGRTYLKWITVTGTGLGLGCEGGKVFLETLLLHDIKALTELESNKSPNNLDQYLKLYDFIQNMVALELTRQQAAAAGAPERMESLRNSVTKCTQNAYASYRGVPIEMQKYLPSQEVVHRRIDQKILILESPQPPISTTPSDVVEKRPRRSSLLVIPDPYINPVSTNSQEKRKSRFSAEINRSLLEIEASDEKEVSKEGLEDLVKAVGGQEEKKNGQDLPAPPDVEERKQDSPITVLDSTNAEVDTTPEEVGRALTIRKRMESPSAAQRKKKADGTVKVVPL
jgi:hypothetical protein